MLSTLVSIILQFSGLGSAPPPSSGRRGRPSALARTAGSKSATVTSLVATPGTISFHAANPDGGPAAGSSVANVTWMADGSSTQNWTLSVQAGGTTFTGCSTIPVSAVTVTCASGSVGNSGSSACSGPFTLSTTSQQAAGGVEGDGLSSYSINLSFALAESWRYVAQSSCSLTLTYTVSAQ